MAVERMEAPHAVVVDQTIPGSYPGQGVATAFWGP